MSKNVKIAGLLFLSGFCALIYQTVWLRELRLIMGASTPATGTVLAIFMGGLGLGGLLLGKRADRVKRPLEFYANLEAGIAAFSALTPFILYLGRSVYLGLGGTLTLGMFWGTIVRILISFVVLIIPTFLMGGTLPAAARAARSVSDISNKGLALLYGANTLGAVAGAVLSTFHLLEVHGNRKTLWIACIINLLVFIMARVLSRSMDGERGEEYAHEEPAATEGVTAASYDKRFFAPAWVVLLAATVTGFVFFLMELVWYRMLGPILGGSTYTFGTILAIALLGIGGGGLFYSFSSKRDRLPSLSSFAWTCALEALFLIIPFALGDRLAELALVLRNIGFFGFWGYVSGWVFICAIVVFPVSLIAGYQFPLLISLLHPKDEGFAWKIGLTYGCNTAGSIAGSLLGGFGLLPLLTAPGAWKLAAYLLVGISFFTTIVSLRRRAVRILSPATVLFILVVTLPVAFSFSEGPTAVWRHAGIGAGRGYSLTGGTSPGQFQVWKDQTRWTVLREWDGVESSVALVSADGLSFSVNGKSDGHSLNDAGTQIMSGLIAAIFHEEPKTCFVVGLGTGSTAGWLASVPTMERVDVAEIEPAIKHVAEACGPVNGFAMKNPKMHVMIGDGREIIMSSPRKYDIIVSEPSNPYRAGISSLFTLDFYRSVASRLNPGGIFVHWVQAYEIDASSIWMIYKTVSEVFPYVETWQTSGADLALVASMKPFQFDTQKLRERIATKPYIDALKNAWHTDTLEGFLARRIAGSQLAQKIHALPGRVLNTDDHNHLEFDFARSVGSNKNFNDGQIYAEGRKFSDFYLPFTGQDVNWTEVERKRLIWIPFAQRDKSILKAEEQTVKTGLDEAYAKGNWTGARQILRSNSDQLPYNTNRALLTVIFIEADDPRTEKTISDHATYRPQEGIALKALYSIKKKQWDQALASSLDFIEALRKDPWASDLVVTRLFSLLPEVGKNTKEGPGKLINALLESPFAVYVHDNKRYQAAFAVAKADPGGDHCNALRDQKFYFQSGNAEYLTYLRKCSRDDKSVRDNIEKEIQRIKEFQSPGFGQIMEYMSWEANNR